MRFINEMDSFFIQKKNKYKREIIEFVERDKELYHEKHSLEGYSYTLENLDNIIDAGVKIHTASLYECLSNIDKKFCTIYKYVLKIKDSNEDFYQLFELHSNNDKNVVVVAMLGSLFNDVIYALHPVSGKRETSLLSRVALNVYDILGNSVKMPLDWDEKLCVLGTFGSFLSFPTVKNGECLYGGRPKEMVFSIILKNIEMVISATQQFEKFYLGKLMEKSLSMNCSAKNIFCYSDMSPMITPIISIEDHPTKENLMLHGRYSKHINLFDNGDDTSESSRIHEHSFLVNSTLDDNELERFVYYEINWGYKTELVVSLNDYFNSILEKIDLGELASKMPTFYKAYNNSIFADSEKGMLIIGKLKTIFKYEINAFKTDNEKNKTISDFEHTLKTLLIELRNVIDYIESRDNKEEKKGNDSIKRMVGFQLLSRLFIGI